MIEYYKKRANEYEIIYCKPERKIYIEEFKSYLSNYFMNRNVLELACGTGFWTECISLTAKSIKATDINDSVLEIAKTKNYRSDCKIDFTIMDHCCPVNFQNLENIAG